MIREIFEYVWNVVYIYGNWQFVECIWGVGFIDEWGVFIKNFFDFYFLIKLNYFIVIYFLYMDNDMFKS